MTIQHSSLRKRVMQAMSRSGINLQPAPEPVSEADRFPRDITKLSELEVRRLLSFWTGHLGYLNTMLARASIDHLAYDQEVKQYERRHRLLHREEGNKKDAKWVYDDELVDDELYQRLLTNRLHASAAMEFMKALQKSYEAYFAAASRELTARISMYERDHSHRSGT